MKTLKTILARTGLVTMAALATLATGLVAGWAGGPVAGCIVVALAAGWWCNLIVNS